MARPRKTATRELLSYEQEHYRRHVIDLSCHKEPDGQIWWQGAAFRWDNREPFHVDRVNTRQAAVEGVRKLIDETLGPYPTETELLASMRQHAPELFSLAEDLAGFDGRNSIVHIRDMARALVAKIKGA
jgi:hypothetical protein